MIGYVYLMTNGMEYKIGLSENEPTKRMKQLQTGNSSKIDVVAYTVCKDMRDLEGELHREFANKRKNGEWFALNDDDLYTIFDRFKVESINTDMSLIPEVVIDVDKFMEIDGQRLAQGEKLVYKDKYLHIENHKDIIMGYMKKTEDLIKRDFEIRAEQARKEKEEYGRLYALLEQDAERVVRGENPLHTLDYSELEGWKYELDRLAYRIKDRIREERLEAKAKADLAEVEAKAKADLAEVEAEAKNLGFIEQIFYKKSNGVHSPREYLEKDKKRVSLGFEPIYQEYYTTGE